MPTASLDDRSNLWDFSLRQYARAGVADACLRLQDEHGVNVNVLFWCLWLEQRGLTLDAARLRNAQKRIHAWDEHYVVPLRQLRRRMKAEFGGANSDIEQVRSQIKQAELLAEKQVLSLLEVLPQSWGKTAVASAHLPTAGENLRFYLQYLNVAESAIREVLALLDSGTASVTQERI
ncbi:TIGR02444 family protein [Cellvibrio sp.]